MHEGVSHHTPLLEEDEAVRRSIVNDGSGPPGSFLEGATSSGQGPHKGLEANVRLRRRRYVDVGRGITIFLMIFVNHCDGDKPFWIAHAVWDGMHLADTVMPAFLFIVGVSIALSTQSHMSSNETIKTGLRRVGMRSIKLFALGIFLQGGTEDGQFPAFNLRRVRIMGVLQRISIAYFFTATLFLLCLPKSTVCTTLGHDGHPLKSAPQKRKKKRRDPSWVLWAVAITLFIAYTLCSLCIPVPSCPYLPPLAPTCNLASYLDTVILSVDHMYRYPLCVKADPPCFALEPEGLFTSLGAIITCFLGLYYGVHLNKMDVGRRVCQKLQLVYGSLVIGGVCLHASGLPLNKQLYSSSYILMTAGLTALLLNLLSAIEAKGNKDFEGAKIILLGQIPFMWLGMNSILVFAGDEMLHLVLQSWFWWESRDRNLYNFIVGCLKRIVHSEAYAQLCYGLLIGCFWMYIARFLYHRKIFIKV